MFFWLLLHQEMRSQWINKDQLQLLQDVSGAFRPGILTTLVDVFAGRKIGGYIEGSITIWGYPKNQTTFANRIFWSEYWSFYMAISSLDLSFIHCVPWSAYNFISKIFIYLYLLHIYVRVSQGFQKSRMVIILPHGCLISALQQWRLILR